ncbi:GlxA family transcriptional regulator [Roseateles violae]|uniref:Helix-turn-helix domain-containing protein n=1 Tax=Roseateles violae TaxID=3058042 RepID=A0ABT8DP05_9BURK|nr:helix-turn-helix domain-containing protein [Pelomonas sp. PFR6]MDN3920097.1 helix-turn-helix domain-containing protein [Pelomonas sp. PFR6]
MIASPPLANSTPQLCALLLLPGFSLRAAAGIIEVLQAANELQDEANYRFSCVSPQGGPVRAAAGVSWDAEPFDVQRPWNLLLVLAGECPPCEPAVLQQLRLLDQRGCVLAGVDGGSALLAAAGLLEGQRATADWTLIESLQQAHPGVLWSSMVWEIAGRLSCAGGSASVDLMLTWLTRRHGERLGQELMLALGLERVRGADERQRQRAALAEHMGTGSPKLSEAVALMEANLGEPLPTEEIARLVGVSRRQLERLFKQHLDALPSRYYLELRLDRARRLLQQSSQSILQIGLSCGFSSGPHFSNAYKTRFGHTPRDERSQRAAAWRMPGDS